MASAGNRHCANCTSALSFPIVSTSASTFRHFSCRTLQHARFSSPRLCMLDCQYWDIGCRCRERRYDANDDDVCRSLSSLLREDWVVDRSDTIISPSLDDDMHSINVTQLLAPAAVIQLPVYQSLPIYTAVSYSYRIIANTQSLH